MVGAPLGCGGVSSGGTGRGRGQEALQNFQAQTPLGNPRTYQRSVNTRGKTKGVKIPFAKLSGVNSINRLCRVLGDVGQVLARSR